MACDDSFPKHDGAYRNYRNRYQEHSLISHSCFKYSVIFLYFLDMEKDLTKWCVHSVWYANLGAFPVLLHNIKRSQAISASQFNWKNNALDCQLKSSVRGNYLCLRVMSAFRYLFPTPKTFYKIDKMVSQPQPTAFKVSASAGINYSFRYVVWTQSKDLMRVQERMRNKMYNTHLSLCSYCEI